MSETVGPWDIGQPWVGEAVREQEEHIKRSHSCQGVLGRSHAFRAHGVPAGDGGIGARFSACVVCGVTESKADYDLKIDHQDAI